MSVYFKRILSFVLSAAVISGFVSLCCLVCNHPSEEIENTVSSFYREPNNTLDVVSIGSSAANKDFQPAVIWQKARITSYNFAVGACSANIYSSMLKEVISKQPDALYLIDIDGFVVDDKFQKEKDPVRLWADSMPKNANHKEIINKYFSDNKAERYFPFIRYHRYMTSLAAYIPISVRLVKKDINNIKDPLGGATANSVKHTEAKEFISDTVNVSPLDTYSSEVFEDFLKYCKSEKLAKILFISFPKSYNNESTLSRNTNYAKRTNYIRKTVEEYGYKVFDYNSLGNPADLDYKKDFADTLHLRTEGAVKFSKYFGQYLSENYEFPEKNEAIITDWDSRMKEANEILGL